MNIKKANSVQFLRTKLPHSTATLNQYWLWIQRLCKFANVKKAEQITIDQLRDFFNSLTHLSSRTTAQAHNAIRQIYTSVLWDFMPSDFKQQFDQVIVHPKQPKYLPAVDFTILSPDQIQSWLANIYNPTLQVGCTLLHNPGLLYPQLITLRIEAVKYRGKVLVCNGKQLLIPSQWQTPLQRQRTLAKLQNTTWLFPSKHGEHLSVSTFQKALKHARPADLPTGSGARCLRASYIVNELRSGRGPAELMWQCSIGPTQIAQYLKLV